MNYDIIGFVSAIFVLLTSAGIFLQLKLIWKRKERFLAGTLGDETPTSILSLNRFSASFLAIFSVFLYGLTLENINGYLVWPRVFILAGLLWILFEIKNDRKDILSNTLFYGGVIFTALAILLAATEYRVSVYHSGAPHLLIVFAAVVLIQGGLHQVHKIRVSGRTGALSLRMHQFYLAKDISSGWFGIVMGLHAGWPIFLMHFIGVTIQSLTMLHFRWVRTSALAKERRDATA